MRIIFDIVFTERIILNIVCTECIMFRIVFAEYMIFSILFTERIMFSIVFTEHIIFNIVCTECIIFRIVFTECMIFSILYTDHIIFNNVFTEHTVFVTDYLLSNNHVNSIIVHKFDFSDEEVMAYYISFLKTLSLKLNAHTIHFFYNEVRNSFRSNKCSYYYSHFNLFGKFVHCMNQLYFKVKYMIFDIYLASVLYIL